MSKVFDIAFAPLLQLQEYLGYCSLEFGLNSNSSSSVFGVCPKVYVKFFPDSSRVKVDIVRKCCCS